MRGRSFGCIALISASPVLADLAADEADVLPRILSSVSVEISDAHIGQEQAILLRNADPDAVSADLVILAGAPDDRQGQPILVVRDLVYAGTMAGQMPWLEVSAQGSLLVKSEQTGIGRSPWEETLALAERDGQVLVAGYTLNRWDRITAGAARCDWNLLTGTWTMNYDIPPGAGKGHQGKNNGKQPLRIMPDEWAMRRTDLAGFCQADLGD